MRNPRYWSVVLLLVAALVLLETRPAADHNPPSLPLSRLPHQLQDWTGRDLAMDQETLDVLGAGDFLSRNYFAAPQTPGVNLFIGYFATQRTGQTIHSPKNCLPGAGWVFDSSTTVELTDPQHRRHTVGEYVISNGESKEYVIYWYQAHGHSVANEYLSKLYLIADAVRMNRTDGALVRIITPISQSEPTRSAQERAESFAQLLMPQLSNYIPD